MIKIEDFENAPDGATATRDLRNWVMKADNGEQYWITPWGFYVNGEEMERRGFTLNPTVPTSAREALDLAWELAHEVKEGQTIPKGTRYLEDQGSGLKENRTRCDINISPGLAPALRTLDPLPDPEPEWLDAPAVIAHVDAPNVQPTSVFVPTGTHPDRWARFDSEWTFHWNELRNVIPLYPKEGQNS